MLPTSLRSFALGLALLASACDSSNPAKDLCTQKTLDALFTQCKQSSPFDASGDCLGISGAHEAYAAGGYAVKACQAGEQGVYFDCVVAHPTECASADESVQTSLRNSCSQLEGNPHGRTPDCTAKCDEARKACDAACSKTDAKACLDCSSACGVTQAQCWMECPERAS